MADNRTYLINRKHYRATDKNLPAEVKAKIAARSAELDKSTTKSPAPVQASDIDPKYGSAPTDDSLPEDFPGFNQLRAAGYTTYADLKDMEDYTVVTGIGPATAREIKEALETQEA